MSCGCCLKNPKERQAHIDRFWDMDIYQSLTNKDDPGMADAMAKNPAIPKSESGWWHQAQVVQGNDVTVAMAPIVACPYCGRNLKENA